MEQKPNYHNESLSDMIWPGSTQRGKLDPPNPDPDHQYFSDEPIPWEILYHPWLTIMLAYRDDDEDE